MIWPQHFNLTQEPQILLNDSVCYNSLIFIHCFIRYYIQCWYEIIILKCLVDDRSHETDAYPLFAFRAEPL